MITSTAKHNGHSHIRTPYQLMLIVAVILAAYYPIAFGDFSRIDDYDIIKTVSNLGAGNLHDLFMPHSKYGAYYRPVLFLSYQIDKYVFNLDPGFMHLHNILLHAINALLIFWLVRQVMGDSEQKKNFMPLLSALIFGLHPITTESVCWIAGRTDVLACTFILLSANCIIRFKKVGSYRYIVLSGLFMAMGFLTKEVALAFLPGAFFLMDSPLYPASETAPEPGESSQSPFQRYRNLFFLLFVLGAILLFFLLRYSAFESNSGRIAATIRFLRSDIISGELIFLQTLGFYIKKIFFPFPLNFAITELDPLYELLGLPVVIACLFIMLKRNQLSALFMTGIFLIIPSFIIALGQIAWTSFAERYMYLPTAFIMVSSVIFVGGFIETMPSFSIKKRVFVTLLLAVMAIATFHRSALWTDSLSFLKDTVAKNPDFQMIRGQYADELAIRGDIKNARIQYAIANEYNKTRKRLKNDGGFYQLQYWDMPELGLADLLVREHKTPEAIAAYEKIIRDSKGESIQALNNVIVLYGGLLNEIRSRSDSDRIKEKLSFYSKKSNDGNTLFWLGRMFLTRGDKQKALAYFKKAESKFSVDNTYKAISQKLIARLENN
jgi:tetratricopeptide (TPR) repeat protein